MSLLSSLNLVRRGCAKTKPRAARLPSPLPPPPLHYHLGRIAPFTSSSSTRPTKPYESIMQQPAFGKAIDVHTHLYLPGYMDLLRSRKEVPRVIPPPPNSPIEAAERLLILPGEDADVSTASGRPIGREYWSVEEKLAFMDAHGIQASVLSPANPWLDFLPPSDALPLARALNDELHALCSSSSSSSLPSSSSSSSSSGQRLYAFGFLPLHPSLLHHPEYGPSVLIKELERLASPPFNTTMRGVIIPAQGLDDPLMDGIYEASERLNLVLFVHPHYGLGGGGGKEGGKEGGGKIVTYGHVLPLALGFPFETSLAVARLVLSGFLDKYPSLLLLLAHAGGTLPFLAGRLDSCVEHDAAFIVGKEGGEGGREGGRKRGRLEHLPSFYLRRNFVFDSVIYHKAGLDGLRSFLKKGGREGGREEGGAKAKVMWGTDHPFFPPLEREGGREGGKEGGGLWPSTMKNYEILWEEGEGGREEEEWREGVVWRNASELLRIPV